MSKQTIVRPLGIVTQPNEYGELPAGSLKAGNGIQIRRQSIIEPRNGFDGLAVLDPPYNRTVKLWPKRYAALTLPETYTTELADILVIAEDPLTGDKRLFNQEFGGPITELLRAGAHFSFTRNKAHFATARNRTIITSDAPPSITTTTGVRPAGLPPLLIYDISADGSGTNWEADKFIGYAAVLRYEEPGGYEVRGPVLAKLAARNTDPVNDRAPHVYVSWSEDAFVPEGSVIEFYRVPQQLDEDLLGDEYRFAFEYPLTTSDIAAHSVDLIDRCLDESLGGYLYSNGSQEGPTKINDAPPQSRDVFTFKGATFYVTSDITQQFSTRVPSFWGALFNDEHRVHGFGWRETTATLTTGDANVTIGNASGVVPGQRIFYGPGLSQSATIISVVGSLITMDATSTITGAGETVSIIDVVTVDGHEIVADYPGTFLSRLGVLVKNGDINVGAWLSPTLPVGVLNVQGLKVTFRNFKPDGAPFEITATNGQNFSPALAEYGSSTPTSSKGEPRADRVHFSKIKQPEHVPPDNTFPVGDGAIIKLWATQDSLFAFCTDGIYRIDGDGDDWSVKPFDPDVVLLSADAVDSMDNVIYAFTNVGLIGVTDSGGVQKITAPIFNGDFQSLWLGEGLEQAYASIACDRPNHECWVNFRYADGYIFTYIWNSITNTLVSQNAEQAETFAYSPVLQSMIAAVGDELRSVEPTKWMATDVEFNSIFADDLGLLKQWIDVTLFMEDLGPVAAVCTPRFEGTAYPSSYQIPVTAGAFDHIVAPLLIATHSKHCRFGFLMESASEGFTPYYRLKGLTYRYRVAAEPLGR